MLPGTEFWWGNYETFIYLPFGKHKRIYNYKYSKEYV